MTNQRIEERWRCAECKALIAAHLCRVNCPWFNKASKRPRLRETRTVTYSEWRSDTLEGV